MTTSRPTTVEEDKLESSPFATLSTFVPFHEPAMRSTQPDQSEINTAIAQGTAAQRAQAHSCNKVESLSPSLVSDASSAASVEHRVDDLNKAHPLLPSIQSKFSAQDLEDATAANWGSHLWIQIGSGSSRVSLETGHHYQQKDDKVYSEVEPTYSGLKE